MDTKEKIIKAATSLFAEKGKYGTFMEEIASNAKINKAMIYYYFSTKDNLYQTILEKILTERFLSIQERIQRLDFENESPDKLLKKLLEIHFEIFSSNNEYSKITFQALVNDPELFHSIMLKLRNSEKEFVLNRIASIFEKGKKQKIFREISHHHLMINFLSINIIHFIGKPLSHSLSGVCIKSDEKLDLQHGKSVIDILMNGILIK